MRLPSSFNDSTYSKNPGLTGRFQTIAVSSFMDFFSHPLLSLVDDVSEGTPLASAEKTLGRLGFLCMDPVADAVPGSPDRTWVHPEGLILSARLSSSPSRSIASARLGAVVNFGWQPLQSLSDLPSGGTWLTPEGQSLVQVNASLFGTVDQGRTLKGVLKILGEQGGRLEPFERWQQEAQANSTGTWLFVVGNDILISIGYGGGIAQWLSKAPEPLRAFVQNRYERLCLSSTAYQASPHENLKHLTTHLQKSIHARGLTSLPVEETARLQHWVQSTQPDKPFEKDMGIHSSGVSQATLLALRGGDTAGKWQHKRLLSWLKTAPKKTLEDVCGIADGAGHTVLSLLVASVADSKSRDYQAYNHSIHEAFAVVAKRLGTDTLERFLNEDGNGLGWVLGTLACQRPSPTDCREMMRLLSTWETLGVRIPPTAVLRSCHQAQLGVQANAALETPEDQMAFLKRNVKPPSAGTMDLDSFNAFLKERFLQQTLTCVAPSLGRSRLRL